MKRKTKISAVTHIITMPENIRKELNIEDTHTEIIVPGKTVVSGEIHCAAYGIGQILVELMDSASCPVNFESKMELCHIINSVLYNYDSSGEIRRALHLATRDDPKNALLSVTPLQ